jgi:hypothetical protein
VAGYVDEGASRWPAVHRLDAAALVRLPTQSLPAEHFGWIGAFWAMDADVSNALTRELLGWAPTHPGLLADLDSGAYAEAVPHAAAG